MANNENINKVIYGTSTLIDLTEDTVSADRMYKGDIAHAADGSEIVGTAEVTVEDTCLIMPEGLVTPIGTVDPDTHKWVRPDYLPDLDSIYNNETNTIYMTIDATGRIPDPHVDMMFYNNGAYTIQEGHIENGVFIAETTETKSSGAYFTKVWEPTPDLYPVIKISGSSLNTLKFRAWTSAEGRVYEAQYQPIIEWIGHMNKIDANARTAYFTEREKIKINEVTSTALQARWNNAYSLQDLYVEDWDTSNWNVTILSTTWQLCYSLAYLDVSNWDTSNWAVTNLSNTFYYCCKLEYLDLSSWDTSNWKVTAFNGTFQFCGKLKFLDVSTWDTSEWTVTTISNTWNYCYFLEELDLSHWDTSNWKVTTLNSTWSQCINLKYLNLTGWDTSGWTVNALGSTWCYCTRLKKIEGIENFDTSNWTITSLRYTWQHCNNLLELDLSRWNTSKWNLDSTGLNSTWEACYSITKIDCSNWDTSGWGISSLSSTWLRNFKLKTLKVEDWDTSEWVVTTMLNMCGYCSSLERLPFENWDVSNWNITTLQTSFIYNSSLRELDLSHWNTSNWSLSGSAPLAYPFANNFDLVSADISCFDLSKITDLRSGNNLLFLNARKLQHVTFGDHNNGKFVCSTTNPSIRFDQSPLLTHQSILNIFNILKSGVSDKTCQIGSANLAKMTAEEKAIATNKGWTLT